jgi:hypothetical protein
VSLSLPKRTLSNSHQQQSVYPSPPRRTPSTSCRQQTATQSMSSTPHMNRQQSVSSTPLTKSCDPVQISKTSSSSVVGKATSL